jgi:hypothetical protein
MDKNVFPEVLNSVKSNSKVFVGKIYNFIKSAKLISAIILIGLIIIFRDVLWEFSAHFLIIILSVILLSLIFIILRIFILVSPALMHIIRMDFIKSGIIKKIDISGKFDRSLLLEDRFTYCKKEMDALEELLKKTDKIKDEESQKIYMELHHKKNEIENKLNENVKNFRILLEDYGIIETNLKVLSNTNTKEIFRTVAGKSFNLLFILLFLLSIPIIFYLIYFLLKSIKIIP